MIIIYLRICKSETICHPGNDGLSWQSKIWIVEERTNDVHRMIEKLNTACGAITYQGTNFARFDFMNQVKRTMSRGRTVSRNDLVCMCCSRYT